MRVSCPACHKKAVITHSKKLHEHNHYRELYCSCTACSTKFKLGVSLLDTSQDSTLMTHSAHVTHNALLSV